MLFKQSQVIQRNFSKTIYFIKALKLIVFADFSFISLIEE